LNRSPNRRSESMKIIPSPPRSPNRARKSIVPEDGDIRRPTAASAYQKAMLKYLASARRSPSARITANRDLSLVNPRGRQYMRRINLRLLAPRNSNEPVDNGWLQ